MIKSTNILFEKCFKGGNEWQKKNKNIDHRPEQHKIKNNNTEGVISVHLKDTQ